MDNDSFNEIEDGNSFFDIFFILMTIIAESDEIVFIFEDSFFGDNGSADVAD